MQVIFQNRKKAKVMQGPGLAVVCRLSKVGRLAELATGRRENR
jgi:hypothetical protein